jgi:3-phenylpropionate/trans-cinnamate dioxygenase ferredoxin subunit
MYNYAKINPNDLDFITIADVGELTPGERIFATIDGTQIILLNIAGEFFAIGDVCSHDGNVLDDAAVEGYEMVCPRHGAHFDIRSGEAVSLPAVVDIPAYPIRIRENKIEVGIPKAK